MPPMKFEDIQDKIVETKEQFDEIVKDTKIRRYGLYYRFKNHVILTWKFKDGNQFKCTKERYDFDPTTSPSYRNFNISYEKFKDIIVENEEDFYKNVEDTKRKKTNTRYKFEEHVKLTWIFGNGEKYKCTKKLYERDPQFPPEHRRKKATEKAKKRSKCPFTSNYAQENNSIQKIVDIVRQSDEIDIELCPPEGCFSDLRVRLKGSSEDKWWPTQHKSCSADNHVHFQLNGNYYSGSCYKDMLLLCHGMKKNIFLYFMPNTENLQDQPYYNMYKESNGISGEQIVATLKKYINEYPKFGKSKDEIDGNGSYKYKIEYIYIRKREKCLGNHFKMKRVFNTSTDFVINDCVRVQEKTRDCRVNSSNSHKFPLHKSDGCHKIQQYNVGDNNLYWFNLCGTDIFYVIPENSLLDNANNNKIRSTITLHADMKKNPHCYKDIWTYDYRFSYEDMNRADEKEILRLKTLVEN